MLLYVDKKKQKRQRIRLIILTLVSVFILFANLFAFRSSLHIARDSLVTYRPFSNLGEVSVRKDVVSVFTAKGGTVAEIVVIPEVLSRENLVTIGMVAAKFMPAMKEVYFTSEVSDSDYLLRLIRLFVSDVHLSAGREGVIITTRLDDVDDIIKQRKLSVSVFNYNLAKKQIDEARLTELADERFPLPKVPTEQLAREKMVLADFAHTYRVELIDVLKGEKTLFPLQYFMLQKLNVCLGEGGDVFCQIGGDASLQKNLRFLAEKLSTQPDKLILLTSLQEVVLNDFLEDDDGVILRYGKREELFLPKQKIGADDVYNALKKKMGINPDYSDDNMKFYRFKTVEVDINEKI